jgi:cobalamin biosynthesis protein CobC
MGAHLADESDLRFFEHGGRLNVARAAYPEAPEPWIDLSTGISPWAYPVPQPPRGLSQRLPEEAGLLRLTEFARVAYKVPPMSAVVPLPGSDAGLSILPWLFREPKRVAVLAPCYPGHATAWNAAGHSVSEIGSLDRVGSAAILIAANPNNPDGRFIEHAKLAAALPSLRHRNGLLVVDEAFADADESHSLLPHVARLDYTLVFRSIGKFYGAGGVRLGFAITSHPVAGRLREALGAWPISAQAIAFGEAALADGEWAARHRTRLKDAAGELDAALTGAGCRVLGGTALFRLAEYPLSRMLFSHLARKGILTRPFKDRSVLRFGLPGTAEEFERLREALQSAPRE